MSKQTGGPAFPNITPDMPVDGHPGMALRDWFAGKALAAIIAAHPDTTFHDAADDAYAFADAMLKARGES